MAHRWFIFIHPNFEYFITCFFLFNCFNLFSARDFNLELAKNMLRQSVEWRQLNRVSDILNSWTPPKVFENYFSFGQCGKDKFGCPGINNLCVLLSLAIDCCYCTKHLYVSSSLLYQVFLRSQGRMDMKGLLQSATRKHFLRYQIWLTGKANQEMRLESARCGVINTYMTFVS